MIFRRSLIAAASVAALLTGGMVSAGAASAAATYHHICNDGPKCLYSHGYDQKMSIQTTGSLTNFYQINRATWQGHTVWEYKQVGTNNCLTDDSSDIDYVIMYTCGVGNPAQLWWQSGAGNFVNDYATYLGASQSCMTNYYAVPQDLYCNAQPGNNNQLFEWTGP